MRPTIKNLRTQGQITTNGSGLSGLVYAAAHSTFFRCVSDVKLTGGNDKRPIEAAGMIGTAGALDGSDCTLIDCIVKGSITNRSPKTSIAMAGLSFATYNTMTNCLYLGTNNAESDERNYTFGSGTVKLKNCHYLNPCGTLQGEPITVAQLRSGEVTYKLQAGRDTLFWGQTIGTDTVPLLTTEAAKQVYGVKFSYNGEVKAMRYANKGGHVVPPTVQELLGADYAPNITYALSFEGDFSASSTVTGDTTVVANVVFKDISIATKADWRKFCDRVNRGETTLNAKMTADVDLGEDTWQVGAARNYSGTFDGQGHTLTVNWNSAFSFPLAPFAVVENATIKNLHVKGQITNRGNLSGLMISASGTTTVSGCVIEVNLKSSNDVTGMINWTQPNSQVTITDCVVKGALNSDATNNMAGFVYKTWGSCTLTNCLYAGTNNAEDGYTFAPYSANLDNCYYLNACGTAQGEQVTKDQLKNGYVAYQLQAGRNDQVWGQAFGSNAPQLTADGAKRVRKVEFTYNNRVKATRYATHGNAIYGGMPTFTAKDLLGSDYNEHHYYSGITFEGGFNGSTIVNTDRTVAVTFNKKDYYEIASKEDWKAFCDLVKSGQNVVDAKMTADVNLGGDIAVIGSRKNYSGIFDGQGHTLTVNWNVGNKSYIAPFYIVEKATIKNLRTEGQITSNEKFLSGLVGNVYGTTTISGYVSAVNITSSYDNGGCNAAGLICIVKLGANVTIDDCVVKGNITATTDKGKEKMTGFVSGQEGTCTLNNCLYLGSSNGDTFSRTFVDDAYHGVTTTLNNCYNLNTCGTAQGKKETKEQLRNGEVAYLLQNKRAGNFWGQTLGTENDPQPTDKAEKHVCKVDFTYNDQVKATHYATRNNAIYGDMPTFTAKDLMGSDYNEHHYYAIAFTGGFNENTTVSSDQTVAVTFNKKDYYEIASKEDWKTFCGIVNGGQNAVDAKMTADVDLGSDIVIVGVIRNYSGTFDGQGHALTVNWNHTSFVDIAPFKNVAGATIKNLHVKGQNEATGNSFLSGLIQNAYGTVTVSGCVSDVDIKGSSNLAGMIQMVNLNTEVIITDCVVKGALNSATKSIGGFVDYQSGSCTLTNCLYAGTNNATTDNNTFADNATLTNCYYLNACGKPQGTQVTEEQLKSGEVTKKLQGNRTDKCYWAQLLGEMPGLYCAADKSKANYVYYDAAKKGWACEDFRLTDGTPLPIGLDFTAANVTYERKFNGTQNATLCLPYDLYAQGFKAYTLSGGNKNEVHFKEVDDKLTAYTPYYITANGMPQLGGRNIEVKAYKDDKMTTPAAGYKFTGTVAGVSNATAAAANAYILQDDGKFHKVTTAYSAATIPAYRAYIICPPQASGAKELSVVLDGETTGIDGVTNGRADGPVYDLQGPRVADRLDAAAHHRLPAGVYIVGGRKVVVK